MVAHEAHAYFALEQKIHSTAWLSFNYIMTAIKYVRRFVIVVVVHSFIHSLIDRIKWQWNPASAPFNCHQLPVSIGKLLNNTDDMSSIKKWLRSISVQSLRNGIFVNICFVQLRHEWREEKKLQIYAFHLYGSVHCIRWLVYTTDMIWYDI